MDNDKLDLVPVSLGKEHWNVVQNKIVRFRRSLVHTAGQNDIRWQCEVVGTDENDRPIVVYPGWKPDDIFKTDEVLTAPMPEHDVLDDVVVLAEHNNAAVFPGEGHVLEEENNAVEEVGEDNNLGEEVGGWVLSDKSKELTIITYENQLEKLAIELMVESDKKFRKVGRPKKRKFNSKSDHKTGEYLHQCPYCSTFNAPSFSSMKRHLQSCMKLKLYDCYHCSLKCNSKSILQTHLKTTHCFK